MAKNKTEDDKKTTEQVSSVSDLLGTTSEEQTTSEVKLAEVTGELNIVTIKELIVAQAFSCVFAHVNAFIRSNGDVDKNMDSIKLIAQDAIRVSKMVEKLYDEAKDA